MCVIHNCDEAAIVGMMAVTPRPYLKRGIDTDLCQDMIEQSEILEKYL